MPARSQAKRAISSVAGPAGARRAAEILDDAHWWAQYVASPHGRRSARRLIRMRDSFTGRRAIVIGNGPSLSKMDLAPLRHEVTFGLNRLYLLFPEIGFPTSFLVATEQNVIEQFGPEMAASGAHVLLSDRFARRVRGELPESVTYFLSRRTPVFGEHPLWWGFEDGHTVTYIALQLAFWFGFREVILIGVDHSFVVPSQATRHEVVVAESADPNHFHPGYFGPGVKWMLPDLEGNERSYRRAKLFYEDRSARVLDATVGGKLTVFEKVDWEEVVKTRGKAGLVKAAGTVER